MLRTDKEQIVSELAAQLGSTETLIVADYRGLTNKELEALRGELIDHGAQFRIVKNSLTRRAAEQAGASALLDMLDGPTAIAFVSADGDPVAVAKALAATAKQASVLSVRGAIFEGTTLTGADVGQLAALPPTDVLRGQLVGAVVAPLTQLLALVSAPLRDLHGLVDARIKQLEEQGEVVEAVGETPVEAEEASESEAADTPTASAHVEAEEASESEAADTPTASAHVEAAAEEQVEAAAEEREVKQGESADGGEPAEQSEEE